MTLSRISLIVVAIVTHAGAALADPAAPTEKSPVADASRRFSMAYAEVSHGLTPAGAKRGLALASTRIQVKVQELLGVVHAPTSMR